LASEIPKHDLSRQCAVAVNAEFVEQVPQLHHVGPVASLLRPGSVRVLRASARNPEQVCDERFRIIGVEESLSIPLGVWMLATERWPSWMRGFMKWPVGDHISPSVISLEACSYVLVGTASLLLTILLLLVPTLLANDVVPGRGIVAVTLATALTLALGAMIPYIRGVLISRR